MANTVNELTNRLSIVDISSENTRAAKQLLDSITQVGFVYVKNDGIRIPSAEIDDMFAISRSFFQSPIESKEPFAINPAGGGRYSGWLGMHRETLDPEKQSRGDFKEGFNLIEFVDGKAQQALPPILRDNEGRVNSFMEKCHSLCVRIMQLIAIGLEIDERWFEARHDRSGPSGSVFRLLYYPSLPPLDDYDEERDVRAGAHSDYGTITLLFQRPGQPGLEILVGEEAGKERWHPVPVNPLNDEELPILVNVGDLLHYWTGGLLKSTVHRVVFPEDRVGQDRYSMAYFCHPSDDAKLVPVPSKMVKAHGRRDGAKNGRILTAKEHLDRRLAATYGNHE